MKNRWEKLVNRRWDDFKNEPEYIRHANSDLSTQEKENLLRESGILSSDIDEMVELVVNNIREEDAKLAIKAKRALDTRKFDKKEVENMLAVQKHVLNVAHDWTPEQRKEIEDRISALTASLEHMEREDSFDTYKKYKQVGLRNQQDQENYDKVVQPIADRYRKISNKIEQAYHFMLVDLNAKASDKTWGGREIDDEMGDVYGDEKSKVYLKPNEVEVESVHGEFEVVNGVKIELIVVNPKYRGQGLAKARLQELTTLADKYGVNLHLDIAPQDDNTTEEGLTSLYKQFGFVFKGIHGVRKPTKSRI